MIPPDLDQALKALKAKAAEHVALYGELCSARSKARDAWMAHGRDCSDSCSKPPPGAPPWPLAAGGVLWVAELAEGRLPGGRMLCPVGQALVDEFLACDAAVRLYPRMGEGGFG